MTKPMVLARVNDQGKIQAFGLVEWAEKFNREHRLHRPSVQQRPGTGRSPSAKSSSTKKRGSR